MNGYMLEEMADAIAKELHVDRNAVISILSHYWADKIAPVWLVDESLGTLLNVGKPITHADEISELLSENELCSDACHILDWRYLTAYQPTVTASDNPEESEIFGLLDFT